MIYNPADRFLEMREKVGFEYCHGFLADMLILYVQTIQNVAVVISSFLQSFFFTHHEGCCSGTVPAPGRIEDIGIDISLTDTL